MTWLCQYLYVAHQSVRGKDIGSNMHIYIYQPSIIKQTTQYFIHPFTKDATFILIILPLLCVGYMVCFHGTGCKVLTRTTILVQMKAETGTGGRV